MSDEQKPAGESKAGDEVKQSETKVDIVSVNQRNREFILNKLNTESPPAAGSSNADEGASDKTDESNSEIGAPQSATAGSEENDKSSVDNKSKDEKPKGNLEKALQEEREKRKKANLEARQLKEKHDSELAALRREIDELKKTKQDGAGGSDDDSDPEKAALLKQLQEERAKREADDKIKKSDEQKKSFDEYQKKVNTTHDALKDAGHRGFKFCVSQVRDAMLKRFNEGEFTTVEEMNDPDNWKKVYIEDVWDSVKDEFPANNDKELLDKKKEAKKNAGAISNPGPAPKKEEEEKPAPSLDDMNKDYIKKRQEASRKVGA